MIMAGASMQFRTSQPSLQSEPELGRKGPWAGGRRPARSNTTALVPAEAVWLCLCTPPEADLWHRICTSLAPKSVLGTRHINTRKLTVTETSGRGSWSSNRFTVGGQGKTNWVSSNYSELEVSLQNDISISWLLPCLAPIKVLLTESVFLRRVHPKYPEEGLQCCSKQQAEG